MNEFTHTNLYGDDLERNNAGLGADIASQRQDTLDDMACNFVSTLLEYQSTVTAGDLGCGQGALAARLADSGAFVEAFDCLDFSSYLAAHPRVRFHQKRLEDEALFGDITDPFDLVVSQRTLHYLPYLQAQKLMQQVTERLREQGRVFVSASGMGSELVEDYGGVTAPIHQRLSPLGDTMSRKHGIHSPVCLYQMNELIHLLELSGLAIDSAFLSDFGNIKITATKP
mgnify:CR=1 FL=1